MSVHVLRFLYCDDDDCGEVFTANAEPDEPISVQREQARAEGWAVGRKGGKDYCPAHKAGA